MGGRCRLEEVLAVVVFISGSEGGAKKGYKRVGIAVYGMRSKVEWSSP